MNLDLEYHLQQLGVVAATATEELSELVSYRDTREEIRRWHTSLFNHETLEPLF